MGMLHKFNPVRLGFIKEAACRRFSRDPKRLDSLAGLRILDIGCGGGILSEPIWRGSAPTVVGADPAEANIEAATAARRAGQGLTIDYRVTTAEALADAGERFDVVLAMEVVEHVADLTLFVNRCAEMVKPGGLMMVGDHQPHAQELRACDRRRRIRAALAAARHPPVGQVRHARTSSRSRSKRAA